MIHTNKPMSQRPKAKLQATGEIIRKNGSREKVNILGDDKMTHEELGEQLIEEWNEKNKQPKQ